MSGGLFFLLVLLLFSPFIVAIILAIVNYKKENNNYWVLRIWIKPYVKTITASVVSIVFGLLFGCFILLCFIGSESGVRVVNFQSFIDGIQLIFGGIFSLGKRNDYNQIMFGWNGTSIGDMLFNATPLILTGLSVAVAFKTGLFNIGTPGQYLFGTTATLILALSIPSSVIPSSIIWIIAFIGGILAGALWGAIPGFFKAFLNINEVITCIMTNWIAANIVTALFDKTSGPFNYILDPSGTKNKAYVYKTIYNNVSTSKLGLDYIFKGSQVNGGIFVAILIAILVYIIMTKTTFGYRLRACGSNRDAAKYAGINEKASILLSMIIAGGLAGGGAALYFLSGNTEFKWETYQSLPGIAFNGIPVALLAVNNPLGVIFSATFMAYLEVAGLQIKNMTAYNQYISSIIAAVIVYFSAFSLVIKDFLNGKGRIIDRIINRKNKKLKLIEDNNSPDSTIIQTTNSSKKDSNNEQVKKEGNE